MGQVIAVVSGKGGTGKTSLAAHVGLHLAALGNMVLCLDCDMGLRNLDLALGRGIPLVFQYNRCANTAYRNIARRLAGEKIPLMKL